MSVSHLRVELSSPKRSLDGGYGFDLTRYCASCWSRLGRILKRGARCGVCGRRVCKGCRHFVAAKEWICALCYKKKYTPDDSWHEDANIKRFKGSQGKSGTYLLRLTDWSAHGVLEVHKVKDHSGRIFTLSHEPHPPIDYSLKNKLYRRDLKSYPSDPVKNVFNYPLVQRDIQLKRWSALDDAMSSQNHRENPLKYTSANLKQKRKEMREHRAMCLGRGRNPEGTASDYAKKKGYFNRISSINREQLGPRNASFHDYDYPLTPSARRSRSSSNSSANAAWQKEHRRSRKNSVNFPHSAIFYKNEPHMRLSVRGTRIFGRRKSYRAYPTLKGGARANGSAVRSRSSSLPCELSHVESHDFEFWNSGFVQTRVRRLEEELTAKCDDKFSYGPDYEIQSLCSLNLEKILPDGDDYRIAYLSSTSQESSLDYMDDSYCTIGMGTLDVKLNKRFLTSGNEDWDLTFTSTEENDSSDDDEFFYRKYTDKEQYPHASRNCWSKNVYFSDNCEDNLKPSKRSKKNSLTFDVVTSDNTRKSLAQEIHERVDKIFNDVMNCDLEIPDPSDEKADDCISIQYLCDSLNDENPNLGKHEDKEKYDQTFWESDIILPVDNLEYQISSKNTSGLSHCLPSETVEGRFNDVHLNSNINVACDQSPEAVLSNLKTFATAACQEKYENVQNILICNYPSKENTLNNFETKEKDSKRFYSVPKCILPVNESKDAANQNQLLISSSSNEPYSKNENTQAVSVSQSSVSNNYNSNNFEPNVSQTLCIENKDPAETIKIAFPSLPRSDSDIQSVNAKCPPNKENLILYRKSSKRKRTGYKSKLLEINKTEKSESKRNSFLEVDLTFYEPLCTPFAEIYYITYGKRYSTKYDYKYGAKRKISRGSVNEIIVHLINERVILTCKHLPLSMAFLQLPNDLYFGNALRKYNIKRNALSHSAEKFLVLNYETCTAPTSLVEEEKDELDLKHLATLLHNHNFWGHFISSLCSVKQNMYFSNYLLESYLSNLLKEDKFILKYSYNDQESNNFASDNLNCSFRIIQLPALDGNAINYFLRTKFGGISTYIKYSSSRLFPEPFLPKCIDIVKDIYKSEKLILNSERTKEFTLIIFEPSSNLQIILEEMMWLNNYCFLMAENTKTAIFFPSVLREMKRNVEIPLEYYVCDCRKSVSGTWNFCNCKNNFESSNFKNATMLSEENSPQKFKRGSIESSIKYNPPGTKISKFHKILKNRKSRSNRKYNLQFRNVNRLKGKKNVSAALKKQFLISKPLIMDRLAIGNRNHGDSNRTPKETEIANEVPHVGEISESRFAAESRLGLTTSRTGNATFVEYLFPRQLESVRDTAEAHLAISPTRLLRSQSVPAVQPRRLADRESRFVQSGTVREHGSPSANRETDLTEKDCICGGQDFCVCHSSPTDGYANPSDCFESARITCHDRDSVDYACFGSVPTGLRQVISDQSSVRDISSVDCFNPVNLPAFQPPQNMATSDEDPRLINKVTRTPGRNISKLKKFFDTGDSSSADSDVVLKKEENGAISSHPHHVNNSMNDNLSEEGDRRSPKHALNGYTLDKSSGDIIDEISVTEKCESFSYQSHQQLSSSDIPYCRKVNSGGDLWKNVDTGPKMSNGSLWNNAQSNDFNLNDNSVDMRQGQNSFVSSTADLHNLIAASRAELSKKKEPMLSDKSTLETYFTSFENSKPKKFTQSNSTSHSSSDPSGFLVSESESFKTSVTYDCDVDEMNFEEEDVTLSDTSSDEEIRCTPAINTHYLPAYALHTIIEESCEESERDSRTATPTNEPVTSKLERYFSWDIINDAEIKTKAKNDDDSTVYSDSLSEGSGSLNGDNSKEIDPTQLASSRLEKYFTSGLVGNDNYFYPDDAEFLEDAPISDFEEDSIHQKISRSALLSSLESVSEQQAISDESLELEEKEQLSDKDEPTVDNQQSNEDPVLVPDSSDNGNETCDQNEVIEVDSSCLKSDNICDIKKEVEESENLEMKENIDIFSKPSDMFAIESIKDPESKNDYFDVSEEKVQEGLTLKQAVNKEQLAIDVQAIIKKLLVYFSGSNSSSISHNVEKNYISALQILETEIERLIQSISPTSSLENNSCNSSTIDSNNSDYGSDTIESLECMTDEDEASESKHRGNAKYPIVDLFSTTYKMQAGPEIQKINISNETLSIWRRLIQSLQKDNFSMNDSKLCDPNIEAQLYIRDQIINLMHTVSVNENKVGEGIPQSLLDVPEKEITSSLIEENDSPENINEAFNVNIDGAGLLSYHSEEEKVPSTKTESSDEGISVESAENLKTSETNISAQNEASQISCDSDINIDSYLNSKSLTPDKSDFGDSGVLLNTTSLNSEKINVDEVDLKLNCNVKKPKQSDNLPSSLPHFVNIEIDDEIPVATEEGNISLEIETEDKNIKRSSLLLWVSGETENGEKDSTVQEDQTNIFGKEDSKVFPDEFSNLQDLTKISSDVSSVNTYKNTAETSYRDTGYYSFKSSDDNLLNDTPPPDEFMDVPDFKSLKRSVKKFPLSNTLSKSTNNINQVLSVPGAKFNTLQTKNQKSKGVLNSSSSSSKQFASLFSPSAVFKKLTGSKGNDTQTPESSIPSKYLKKYARSSSIDSESMIGAISMPQLNHPKASDSYSALGLYSENDRESSLIADDDVDVKKYSGYSQSVLSLGSHSASMTSVYSAAACQYGYVTVSGDVLFGLNYNQKSQMMEVFVKQCRNLAAVDTRRNKSDPYVKVYLLPDKTKGGKRKTKTKKNTLNPVFNELLRFPVLKHELESRTLWLSVWNSDLFGRNDFLGEIMLPLGYRLLDSPTLRWYPLQERMESLTSPLNYRGELFLALKYVPRDLSLESRFRPAPVISLRGALHVLVKEARNICVNRSGGNFDAFCKSYLLPDKSKSSKQKTPVVKKSRHPKWYYTVIYEDMSIEELKERSLELTVWDHDKITSNEFMGGVRLNIGSGLYHGVQVEWMDARRDEAALWQSMLQSPNMWVDGCLPLRPSM